MIVSVAAQETVNVERFDGESEQRSIDHPEFTASEDDMDHSPIHIIV